MSDTAELAPDVSASGDADGVATTDGHETTWQHEAGVAGDPTAEKYETVGDLFSAYKEASSMIGNSIRFPSKEAGEEDIQKFNESMLERGYYRAPDQDDVESTRDIQHLLGLPQEPNSYQFEQIEGYDGDPESEGAFKQVAHELGLTQSQAAGIHQWLGGNIAESTADVTKASEAAIQELKGEWGQAFDHKIASAQNAAKIIEERVPGISEYMDNMAQQGYDANMIRLMDAVSEMLGEGSAVIPPSVDVGITPAEAMSRLEEMRNNPNHPIHQGSGPAYERAKEERLKLNKAAFGG